MKPGHIFADHLRLVRQLGRGASSAVWLAEDLDDDNRELAVKVMHAAAANNPSSIMRFVQEAQAAAKIEHPNVARVSEHGVSDEGDRFIVMEWLEGETLRERLDRTGPLPIALVREVITQIAAGLSAAHDGNIIHRDIKPANVFLVPEGDGVCVKLLDFGVAKITGEDAVEMTSDGALLGTPAYMSPEQFRGGNKVDLRTDLWSLAVVTYRVLTGVLPFDGDSVAAVCLAVEMGDFESPSQLRPELSVAVDGWFERALQRDRRHRFSSAEEMASALRRALDPKTATTMQGPGQHPPPSLPSFEDYESYGDDASSSSRLIDTSEPLGPLGLSGPLDLSGPLGSEDSSADDSLDSSLQKESSLHALMRSPQAPPARSSRWLGMGAAIAVVLLLAGGSWVALQPAQNNRAPAAAPGEHDTSQKGSPSTAASDERDGTEPTALASVVQPKPTESAPPAGSSQAQPHAAPSPTTAYRPRAKPQPPTAPAETAAPTDPEPKTTAPPSPNNQVDERTQKAGEQLGI